MTNLLSEKLSLPCGAELPNRIAKAAMTEGLATATGLPTPELERLYQIWSDGGAGLLLSGNIQIDADHLERPGNVVIDRHPDGKMASALAAWAQAGTRNGNHFWAQISHSGRQTQKVVNPHPKAPSAVKLGLPGGLFGLPVALTEAEIEEVIRGFGIAAAAVREAGFTGVQVHSAHGYLLSQFLSPRTNLRDDQYGGSLGNRARILLAVIDAVRQAVGADFPVAVKLNSADFQKGGFAFTDSMQVASWLQEAGVDLIEISGGTYEQPKLMGLAGAEDEEQQHVPSSTLMREAYFVDFALAMQQEVSIPMMVTGGFRQLKVMEEALSSGAADIIGIGRPMCVDTDAPSRLLAGEPELTRYEKRKSLLPRWMSFLKGFAVFKTISGFTLQYWYYAQLLSLGRAGVAQPELSVLAATFRLLKHERTLLQQRKK
ncbi:MAG: NADH:flavin oxidoreductase/NADH oxidase family protein [Gammaproteobacteria bacterium]|nr:NADH:flavin oxidoreductase/NADH oxidase family protein [Gammaproteobacteria bacterium]